MGALTPSELIEDIRSSIEIHQKHGVSMEGAMLFVSPGTHRLMCQAIAQHVGMPVKEVKSCNGLPVSIESSLPEDTWGLGVNEVAFETQQAIARDLRERSAGAIFGVFAIGKRADKSFSCPCPKCREARGESPVAPSTPIKPPYDPAKHYRFRQSVGQSLN